jgi:hypothetical protein
MTAANIHLDLDNVLDVALRGVRRASVFLGLGVNAALDDSFTRYQLSPLTNIQLVPDTVSKDTLRQYKEEFRLWIEAGGFRELSETFTCYLDAVHYTCLWMQVGQDKSSVTAIPKRQARFQRAWFPNKFKILTEHFAVGPQHPEYLMSLNRTRNCLVHRLGVVGSEDLQDDTELSVQWLGADMFAEEPNGTRHPFTEAPPDGIFLPEGGRVGLQFVERVRTFMLGSRVILSTRDLAEICWFYTREARFIIQRVLDFSATVGIQVHAKSTLTMPCGELPPASAALPLPGEAGIRGSKDDA